MLWDMIRYKNFDTESPYNREAALWAKVQTDFNFPIDKRSIRDKISGEKNSTPSQPEVLVTRVKDDSSTNVLEVPQDEIEIIETGIEIIETKIQEPSDGIIFLD